VQVVSVNAWEGRLNQYEFGTQASVFLLLDTCYLQFFFSVSVFITQWIVRAANPF
jgi:hypothetical protein